MAIVINDQNNITIDGKDEGHVIDAVRNLPLRAAEIKAAFDLWFIAYDATTQDLRNASAQQVLDANAAKDAAISVANAEIAALGTKPEAQAIIKAQKIAAMEEEIADRNAKLVELKK